MSNTGTPRDDAELEAFLGRESPVSEAYAAMEPVPPPEMLDGKVLALARSALTAAAAKAPAAAKPPSMPADKAKPDVPVSSDKPSPPRPTARPPAPPAARPAPRAAREEDDDSDDALPARRPRWLVPAALAASVLVAVGVGVTMLGGGSSEPDADSSNPLGSMFAKRARERSEAEKAAAQAAADQEAEIVELAPLPPPPVFEPEGPQIEDLDTAIALIRRELVLANQMAAIQDESRTAAAESTADAAPAAPPAGSVSLVPTPVTPAAAPAGVVQPRDRRLTKILELYDGGNPDLAAASLEIFLRDFEDDPISQRILDAQPKPTDAAVE